MKFLAYTVAWALLVSQWNDLTYYYTTQLPPDLAPDPVGPTIITVLLTVILSVATFKELTKGKK